MALSIEQPKQEDCNHPGEEPHLRDKLSPELLTVLEACQVLRISRWTLYDLIRSRAIETIKIGRIRRIPISSISRYIRRKLSEDLE
ncbi:DNA binding domain-containing protein, excisionase family [Lentzea aerocolonigenes]|nr:helix-turn-helix domain-containing protein [Lentzea aerocolonigenes]MCP2245757.1 DNA binding domain-containing protein, excisionase family [Lentzea aerocolonigenes]